MCNNFKQKTKRASNRQKTSKQSIFQELKRIKNYIKPKKRVAIYRAFNYNPNKLI